MDNNKNPFRENIEDNIEENLEEKSSQENSNENENNIENEAEKEPRENIENAEETAEALEEDIQNQENQVDKYEALNNKYIRLAADFDNFRKRTEAEKIELSKYTTVELLKKLTPALDNFDRAQEHLKDLEDCEKIKEGWQMAHKQLLDILSKIGLKEIEALGKAFDPNEHEAIAQVPAGEYEDDTVAMVAQKGYKYQDKIVRPALVGVAKNS